MFGQSELKQKQTELEQKQTEQEGKTRQLEEQLETEAEKKIAALSERCQSLEKRVNYLEECLSSYENALINLRNNNARLDLLEQNMERSFVKLKKLEKGGCAPAQDGAAGTQTESSPRSECSAPAEQRKAGEQTASCAPAAETYSAIDYFDFENHFRGSREVIKERQRQYLDYFSGCKNVIDIGCGRGEFLELLKENHIGATGVDTYDEFVEYCKEHEFSAVCDDGAHYLKSIESTDGIFVGQVVEHLKDYQIIDLCSTAFEKMESGSYLVIETPNPTSLAIYTHAFYVDPSHVKPVHPLTMEYFLQKAGFKDIKIVYTENSKINQDIPALCGESIENLDAFNDAMKLVSSTLFGSQDYAIIARK